MLSDRSLKSRSNSNSLELNNKSMYAVSDKKVSSSTSSCFFDNIQTYITRNARFLYLVVGIIFFFSCHNYLQEYIMNLKGFGRLGVFLGYLEVLGTTVCTAVERYYIGDLERRSQWKSYAIICFCLLITILHNVVPL